MPVCSICHQEKARCSPVTLYSAFPVAYDSKIVLAATINTTTYQGFQQHAFQICVRCFNSGCLPTLGISALLGVVSGMLMWIANGFKPGEWYVAVLVFLICAVVLAFIGGWVVNKFFGYRVKLDRLVRAERGNKVQIFTAAEFSKLQPGGQ